MKAGATDYVLKQQPDRLPSAVLRAVQEAEERTRLRDAEMELVRREKYFRTLTENSLDVVTILDREGIYTSASPSVERVMGYAPHEMVGHQKLCPRSPGRCAGSGKVISSGIGKSGTAHPDSISLSTPKDGKWYRHEAALARTVWTTRTFGGMVAHCRDVSDRWRAEEDLRRSEKQYRLLFHSNPNPMWVFDLETQAFLEVNEAAIQYYGYSRAEFLKMTIGDIRPPEKNGHAKTSVIDADDRGLVWRQRRKNGSFIDVKVIWSPMAFRGHFAALTMATDVTERRRVEHRNQIFSKLSHRMSSATTAPEAAMIICEAADALFKWDNFALDLYSAETDEVFSLLNITTVEGQRVEIPSSLQPKTANALIHRVVSRGAELLSPLEAGDHSAATMLAPIRKGARVIGVLFIQNHSPGSYMGRDLEMLQTLADQCSGALERVRAEQESRESQQRFRDLFENSPDAIFVADLTGTVLDVNQAGCALNGLTRGQLIGKNSLEDLIPPSRRESARQDFEKLATGKLTWVEGESLMADGRVIPVEVRAGRVEYNGKPALLLHIRDITQRRTAEAALHSSELLFRSVWENSVDGNEVDGRERTHHRRQRCLIAGLVGLEAAVLGRPTVHDRGLCVESENPAGNDRSTISEQFLAARSAEQKHRQRQYTLHNGQTVTLETTDSFVEVHGRTLLMLTLFRDVTMQRRLAEQLRQSQKMEAIGQLAGGVAHDFNNILTVIHGHASLLSMSDLDDTAARSAQQITQAAERAAGLTRQLLAFSRRQIIQPKRLDMNKIVGNITDMLGRLLGEDVALQLNYSPVPRDHRGRRRHDGTGFIVSRRQCARRHASRRPARHPHRHR